MNYPWNKNAVITSRAAVVAVCLALSIPSAFASEPFETFTYQGRFFDATGTAPLQDVVDLTLSVYEPVSGCVLYEEVQTEIDVRRSYGVESPSLK